MRRSGGNVPLPPVARRCESTVADDSGSVLSTAGLWVQTVRGELTLLEGSLERRLFGRVQFAVVVRVIP